MPINLDEVIKQAGNAKARTLTRRMIPTSELNPLADTIINLANRIKELQDSYPKINKFTTREEYIRACIEHEKKLK